MGRWHRFRCAELRARVQHRRHSWHAGKGCGSSAQCGLALSAAWASQSHLICACVPDSVCAQGGDFYISLMVGHGGHGAATA